MSDKKKDEFDDLMASGEDTSVGRITAGTPVEMINDIKDSPTILVEGFQGISMSDHIAKIHFVEHLPQGAKIFGRYVLTLAMPHDQLARIAQGLQEAVDRIETFRSEGGD